MPTTLHDTSAASHHPLSACPSLSSRRAAVQANRGPHSPRWWQAPPRMQGFEFGDQRWVKGVWREAYLDGLNFSFRLYGVYRRMHEPFACWVRKAMGSNATSEAVRVLDLGSGGAGPVETLLSCAQDSGTEMSRVTLSDLNPDLDAFRRAQAALPGRIDFVSESLDACDPKAAASAAPNARLRSVCSAFHHFDPESARRLLATTTEQADGLFVMEPMGRSWFSPLYSLPNLLPLLLAPFFARRFSFKKLLIGTLLPVVPLMIVFDGVVSALRMYRPEEALELLPESARRDWHWEFGETRYMLFFRAPYLFGYRNRERGPRMNTPASPPAVDASARMPAAPATPWEVARWGRLLAGLATLAFTVLGLLYHPAWLIGTLLVSLQLVVTALTDRCPLRDALLRMGLKEREDLFEVGGAIRPEGSARRQPLSEKEVAGWAK